MVPKLVTALPLLLATLSVAAAPSRPAASAAAPASFQEAVAGTLQLLAALKARWLLLANESSGWPQDEETLKRAYRAGGHSNTCRLRRNLRRKFAQGKPIRLAFGGGSVTEGHDICADRGEWPWSFMLKSAMEQASLEQLNTDQRRKARGKPVASKYGKKRSNATAGLSFEVDVKAEGGCGLACCSSMVRRGDFSRDYDLIVNDFSMNDEQMGQVKNLPRAYNAVISQMRRLTSRPALLFVQEIRPGWGFLDARESKAQLAKHLKDKRFPGREQYCVNATEAGWAMPAGRFAQDCFSKKSGRWQHCRYAPEHHEIICTVRAAWGMPDRGTPTLRARGMPSVNYRDAIWPEYAKPPKNLVRLWNGCHHPDIVAHDNLFGLVVHGLHELFKEVASSPDAESEEACDAKGEDSVAMTCKPTTIYSVKKGRHAKHFRPWWPERGQPLPLYRTNWRFFSDSRDKWGWILDVEHLNKSSGRNHVAFRLNPPESVMCAYKVELDFLKSYGSEWGAVDVWFDTDTREKHEVTKERLKLASRWTKPSSATARVIIVDSAEWEAVNKSDEGSLADAVLKSDALMRASRQPLLVMHIQPSSTAPLGKRFKFKLTGIIAG